MTENNDNAPFDRTLLAKRRRRAVGGDPAVAFLLAHVVEDIAERLAAVKRDFPIAAIVGAHDPMVADVLAGRFGIKMLVQTDAVAPVAACLGRGAIIADDEALPFRDASLNLIVSPLTLQSVNDLPGVLVQMRRALKPDGLALIALVGGDTLSEMREAFLVAETEIENGASPRVAPFTDVRLAGQLLQRAGFALPVADRDVLTVRYASPLALMADLRQMGATNVLRARHRGFLSRRLLARVLEIYVERFSDPDGRVRATFEIITLTAWAPDASQQQPLRPGSARQRLADALGTTEHPAGEKPGGGGG